MDQSIARQILDLQTLLGLRLGEVEPFRLFATQEFDAVNSILNLGTISADNDHCAVITGVRIDSYPIQAGVARPNQRESFSFADGPNVATTFAFIWRLSGNNLMSVFPTADYHQYLGDDLFLVLKPSTSVTLVGRWTPDARTLAAVDSQPTFIRITGFKLPRTALNNAQRTAVRIL